MKILVVQESNWLTHGPHDSHHLMERLVQRGHEVRVIDFDIDWRRNEKKPIISKRLEVTAPPKVIPDAKITVIRPSIVQLPILEYLSLLYTHRKEVIWQFEEFKPDVVIGFGLLNASIASSFSHKRNVPFVYYVIDELHRLVPQKYFQPLARYVEKRNMENANLVISTNEVLKDYTIRMGADPDRCMIVKHGVDIEHFKNGDRDKIRKEFGFKENDVVLFFMGWLYEFSGLKEVATELTKSEANRNIKLLIVGKGELWNTLQEIKSMEGMKDRIVLLDWKPYDEIPDYLAASDICILPAYNNEIMRNIVPIKLYEYMAAGKPIIATNLPGIVKEFSFNGDITYIEGPEGIIQPINRMIASNIFYSMKDEQRQFIEKNDWNIVTDNFVRSLEVFIPDLITDF